MAALGALAVYVLTLSPDLYWGDSAELTGAAYQGGVPHCTGYPLQMLVAWPLLHVGPLASVPYRMNLLSALFGALATGLLAVYFQRLGIRRRLAASAALIFAFSLTFWSQAVIAEVYTLHIALSAAVLMSAAGWDRTGRSTWLRITAFLYGLCFTHHLMSVLLAPALLALALTSPHRSRVLRELPCCAVLFALPLALYAWLPLAARGSAEFNQGDVRSWQNLVDHVTGAEFRGQMTNLSPAHLSSSWTRLTQWPPRGEDGLLWQQFPLPVLLLIIPGVARLARRRPRWLLVTGALLIATALYALSYTIPDIEAYYLPAFLVLAAWAACGMEQLLVWLAQILKAQRHTRALALRVGAALLCAAPVAVLAANWQRNDTIRAESVRDQAAAELATLKPNALLIVGGGMQYNPAQYLRFVEKYRPDVDIVDFGELAHPERLQSILRQASPRLRIRVPAGFPLHARGRIYDNGLLRQVVLDNLPHRPVYLYYLGAPDMLLRSFPPTAAALRGLYGRATTNLRLLELYAAPPAFAPVDRAAPGPGTRFVLRERGKEDRPVAKFLGMSREKRARAGAEWLRVRYCWRILDPQLAQRAQVRVAATDAGGKVLQELEDPFPGAHSLHRLGQRIGPERMQLPAEFAEEYDLYVPPALRKSTIRLVVLVQLDGTPLSIPGNASGVLPIGDLQ